MLEVQNLHLSYGGVKALQGVFLTVKRGEIVTLIGSNGAGKSSTLNSISGVYRPDKGSILFGEKAIQGLASHLVARLGIIQVPEGRQLFDDMTVTENLEIGAIAAADKSSTSDKFDQVWELFPVLHERRHQLAGTLSGGEQQMLAIARSMMVSPQLLLMDEPSLGLAPLIMDKIFNVIQRLREEGQTILLVEQNAWMSLQISDRGYVMENGQIVLSGPSEDLLGDEMVKKIYLGGH